MTDEAITSKGTPVTVNGREYTMRRLGWPEAMKVARILSAGAGSIAKQGQDVSQANLLQVMFASLTSNEDAVLDLVADVLQVSPEDIRNPELFPMDSIVHVFKALSEHQDVKSFLASVGMVLGTDEA